MNNSVTLGTIATPIGMLGAVVSPIGLAYLTFARPPHADCEAWVRRWKPQAHVVEDAGALDRLAEQLAAYFAGRRRQFTIPIDLCGTPFQLGVWEALQQIPYGEVRAYSDLAAAIGRPRAVRAVGAANGANPIPIVVPCHRLIGKSGALIKYGGGLELKRRLLELEGALPARQEICV
jgi:O-6-methylguanine DNA methyltransferase